MASVGLGGSRLIAWARRANVARLEAGIIDLLADLGMPLNDPALRDDPEFWFRAFLELAKRHVDGFKPLKLPDTLGRRGNFTSAKQAAIVRALKGRPRGMTREKALFPLTDPAQPQPSAIRTSRA